MERKEELISLVERYRELGIDRQIDYDKFYLYSIITHSTAIEGSTITEAENQLLFDKGITSAGKTLSEQMMNLDLKNAYEKSISLASSHADITVDMLKDLSSIVMKNTGSEYKTALGETFAYDPEKADAPVVNVSKTEIEKFLVWLNGTTGDYRLPERAYVVSDTPGYNSWPMIQAMGGKLVCSYSRDNALPKDGHTIDPGSRDSYVRVSSDGGRTWREVPPSKHLSAVMPPTVMRLPAAMFCAPPCREKKFLPSLCALMRASLVGLGNMMIWLPSCSR